MGRYKLLAGGHAQKDQSRPILDAEGKPTGRFETRLYKAGEVVESGADLAKRWPEKFAALDGAASPGRVADLERQLAEARAENARLLAEAHGGLRVPGDPTPENVVENPATAPGGQVSTGWQGGAPQEAKDALAGARETRPAPARNYDAEYGDLDAMTVADLKALAEEEEIDLKGARTKEEIIRTIRAQR